ncbi:hypothetical protein AVEN_9589-1 [Araneus ventricosus]|uniref:Uncharacterized protein n=1 Tax=Araneus ventricosus TaxID=182803 RepID=A0A4Y2H6X4_ARAVE|nr:hypothetical protein AVEN_9589-1 [Araneus ventricosus]
MLQRRAKEEKLIDETKCSTVTGFTQALSQEYEISWILNTAAIYHFCGIQNLLKDYRPVKNTTMLVAVRGIFCDIILTSLTCPLCCRGFGSGRHFPAPPACYEYGYVLAQFYYVIFIVSNAHVNYGYMDYLYICGTLSVVFYCIE